MPSLYAEIMADSPVGYYRLNDRIGRTVDDSGNARTLTQNGSNFTSVSSLVPSDPGGGAIQFDNPTATGTLTSADAAYERTGTGAFTLTFVCKLDTIDTTYRRLISWTDETTGGGTYFSVQYQSAAGFYFNRVNAGTAKDTYGSPSVFDTSTTYHVWAEFTGSQLELYVNNVQMGSSTADTASIASFPGDWSIGGGQFGGGSCKAILDSVAFYSSALGATRRAAHYTAFSTVAAAVLFPHRVM